MGGKTTPMSHATTAAGTATAGSGQARPAGRGDSRARLLAAARDLFVARGFHATRPQDISRTAGVGHGTFYLHFKDKQACFLAFAEEAAEELEAFVAERVPEDAPPYTAIRDTIRFTYEFADAHPGLIAAALADMSVIDGSDGGSVLMERFGRRWAERFAGWQAQGLLAAHVDPEVVGHAMPGMIRQVGAHAAETHGEVSEAEMEAVVRALMAFIAAGLGIARGDGTDETGSA